MSSVTGFRRGSGGHRLFTHHWPAQNPRAAVVLVHGLGEHLGRYEHVGEALAARGVDVRGTDLQGFGGSEGPRAHIDDFAVYLDDIAADVAAAQELGVPVVLLGHSLGGLLAFLYATSERPSPDLLVLSAPSLENTLPRFKVTLARIMSRIAPRVSQANPVDVTELSRDPEVGERYDADPLVVQRSTAGLAAAAFDALDSVPRRIERLDIPTLVLHGGQDAIVAPSVSEPLADLPRVDRVVFDQFRHESFNEEGGTKAIAAVADWIEAQLST